jgi:succinate-acetate transporter protein
LNNSLRRACFVCYPFPLSFKLYSFMPFHAFWVQLFYTLILYWINTVVINAHKNQLLGFALFKKLGYLYYVPNPLNYI